MKTLLLLLAVIGLSFAYYRFQVDNKPQINRIDKLVVLKSERILIAYYKEKPVKTYSIALGREPKGAKHFEGDMKTPEGKYFINDKNPNSAYHKNLGISYPKQADKEYAKKFGKSAGGAIKIHGLKNNIQWIGKLHHWFDWTLGCVAVTNPEIDELYAAVPVGTPIVIKP